MKALMTYSNQKHETAQLKLVNNELKAFNVRYMKSLNLITATGWSITNCAWIKYCQMLADIESHLLSHDELTIYFKYELLNTSSTKYLYQVIDRFNKAHANGKTVKIYWSCATGQENEMVETGLDLAGECDFTFKISRK